MSDFRIYENPEAVAQAAADYLFNQIKTCITLNEQCHVVLPGGSTPARCLELLTDMSLPWEKIHWYPGDERCYPVGHADRNDTMIVSKLFSQADHVIENFHPIHSELGPEQGAEHYAKLIDALGGLDIVVLGMGEDGHTASLFPGNVALDDQRSVVPVYDAPKPPSKRISIGLIALRNAGERIVLVTGDNKREAIAKVRAGIALPVNMVNPDIWFIDEAATTNDTRDIVYE